MKSKYVGITYHKKLKHWRARITVKKDQIYLGCTKTEEEAADLYRKASLKLLGVFECPLKPEKSTKLKGK